jgi:hypothetical protein
MPIAEGQAEVLHNSGNGADIHPEVRGRVLISPLGAKFDPRGELCPVGLIMSPRPTFRGKHNELFKNRGTKRV